MTQENLSRDRRVTRSSGNGPSVRDVLMAAAQYAPCRIVEADDAPPSTQPLPGAPSRVAAPLTLRPQTRDPQTRDRARNDVAGPTTPWQPLEGHRRVYRAVAPPRPASPTPVEPIRAYRPEQSAAPATQVKKHDSYYPMEVPISPDAQGSEGVRESSMFPAAGARRSTIGWALGGLAAFAIVLGLLTVADRTRKGAPAQELPRAVTELPTARPLHPGTAAPQDVRGVDPADLPDTKGVDVSTLPLVSTTAVPPARVPAHRQVAH